MQNRSASPMDDAQMAYLAAQQVGIAWSPDQLVRLEHEWRQMQRSFAYHPSVKVIPLHGTPPAEYQVEFKCRTLYIRDDGQLDYIDTPSIHIWLPPGYPHEPPVVRPMHSLFHPNVTMEGILITPAWEATQTLAQLVQRIGALLAFHTYDPWTVWNPAAMDWVNANTAYLPTDPAANFTPGAGGDPLGRICNNGEKTIVTLRSQLTELCDSLLSMDDPPSADEVRQFAERIRLATNLFLDDDVPDTLRAPALLLDEWAEALPRTTMLFESLRQRHIAAAAALAAAGKVAEVRRSLLKELSTFSELAAPQAPEDPHAALELLPELPKMQAVQATFRTVWMEAEKRLGIARARLAALAPPDPRASFTHSELLERRIEEEIGKAAWVIQDAQEKTSSAINTLSPTAERSRDELLVFERIMGWREYRDLSARSRSLLDRILGWGSNGVQAYFVENEGGVFGPFDFEQRLDLGESALAVRCVGRTSLEVFDLKSGSKLGETETGELTLDLPSSEPGVSFATTFRMTARCDDLWVQVEYLTRQIGEVILKQAKPLTAPKAESWAAVFNLVLSNPNSLATFVEDTKAAVRERTAIVSDLKYLARFKERLATQYLIERHTESVPRFKQEMNEAQKLLKEANQRIAEIFSKSQRDLEHDLPLIPPKFAKEYEQKKTQRDNAQRVIERVKRRLALAAAQIAPRCSTPALYGVGEVPVPLRLAPLAEEVAGRVELLSDASMDQQIATLEEALSVQLRPDAPMATEALPERPEEPAEAESGEEAVDTASPDNESEAAYADDPGAPPAEAHEEEDAQIDWHHDSNSQNA